ncbi:MAG: histidinol dehydrogenase [Candidatus Peribacteraceae bacterium]|nr:histidinol dehydrogenase [Candidatus Peribacteraceae bacterium]
MQIQRLADLDSSERAAILARGGEVSADVKEGVAEILQAVTTRGVAAVLEFTQKFDGVELSSLELSAAELAAVDESAAEYDFLREAAANIQKFHENQLANINSEQKVETVKGVETWREWRPIEKVGIYAPGGLATYPSSVLMQAIPAKIAGCSEIILATPPKKDGSLDPVVIAAAKISGVTKILKVGGAQAIGALAFVEQVEKITGPGNPWVTEAKTQVSAEIPIDMPAGPSEILILADDFAVPKFVAADLLSQAEHASDSTSILVTTSEKLAEAVVAELDSQIEKLSRKEIAEQSLTSRGRILVADDLDSAIEFANEFAAEHLELCVEDSEKALAKIQNAGSVFLGNFSSEPAGDFASGTNHVLPTAGFAKNFAPLSVETFGKKIQVQKISKEGLSEIREVCEKFGELEGLDAHARSISIRFEDAN